MNEYLVVTEETLQDVVEKTPYDLEYLKKQLSDAEVRDHVFVVFLARGIWQYVFIHNRYSVE